jgi:hypothetical protein
MTLKVEHDLHKRRLDKNVGLGVLLAAFVAIVLGLTVVKVQTLDDPREMERFDHVARPALEEATRDQSEEGAE